jgi:mlo protein
MGFISLTITILQDPVSKLCVPSSAYNKWTPCDISARPGASSTTQEPASSELPTRRRLLSSASTHTCQEVAPFSSQIVKDFVQRLRI